MEKNPKIQIVCVFSEKLTLGLSGIRENYGHDDSLPYQADLFVMDRDNTPKGMQAFKRFARVWNDGWGGDSQLQPAELKGSAEYVRKCNELCRKHQMIHKGRPVCEYDLAMLCDFMASLWLDVKKSNRKSTLLYRFDDDPVTIARKGYNLEYYC